MPKRCADIPYEQLKARFHLPMEDVARDFSVSPTLFKKICRRNGIPRWPHRKIRSIDRLIDTLKGALPTSLHETDVLHSEINRLLAERKYIFEHPASLADKSSEEIEISPKPKSSIVDQPSILYQPEDDDQEEDEDYGVEIRKQTLVVEQKSTKQPSQPKQQPTQSSSTLLDMQEAASAIEMLCNPAAHSTKSIASIRPKPTGTTTTTATTISPATKQSPVLSATYIHKTSAAQPQRPILSTSASAFTQVSRAPTKSESFSAPVRVVDTISNNNNGSSSSNAAVISGGSLTKSTMTPPVPPTLLQPLHTLQSMQALNVPIGAHLMPTLHAVGLANSQPRQPIELAELRLPSIDQREWSAPKLDILEPTFASQAQQQPVISRYR